VRPTEFIAALRKRQAGPAYFLRGPDRFLHEECRKALVSSIPAEARQWCLAEIEFQPGGLLHELEGAEQMPMLGGNNFFLFSDPEDFKQANDEDVEALAAYLERPSPFATVVFVAAEPDRRRRFIQLLEKKAELVEMLPLDIRQAADWARDFFRQESVAIDASLAEEIAEKFTISHESRGPAAYGTGRGGAKLSAVNLLAMRTELEKLLTAKPGMKRLEPDDLELIVAFREEREIGKLLRAVAERKCGEALGLLRALLRSKVAETLLLWCVGDLFRQALKSAPRATVGHGPRQPTGTGRGGWARSANPYATSEIAQVALRNYKREELLQALRAVRRADLGIKSSWKDSKILLEFLVWQIVVGKEGAGVPTIGDEMPVPSAEG
jgi:DNA polymerase-3 subunit delta